MTQVTEEERIFIAADEALKMLPDGDTIHVFMNPAVDVLLGADWSRSDVIELLRRSQRIEIAGEHARKMNHGLAVQMGDKDRDCCFVETRVQS